MSEENMQSAIQRHSFPICDLRHADLAELGVPDAFAIDDATMRHLADLLAEQYFYPMSEDGDSEFEEYLRYVLIKEGLIPSEA